MSSQDISRLHWLISTSHPLISATSSSHNTHHSINLSTIYHYTNPTLPLTHNWCYYRQGTSSGGLILTTHSPTLLQIIPWPISSYPIHYSINPSTNKQVTSIDMLANNCIVTQVEEFNVAMCICSVIYSLSNKCQTEVQLPGLRYIIEYVQKGERLVEACSGACKLAGVTYSTIHHTY